MASVVASVAPPSMVVRSERRALASAVACASPSELSPIVALQWLETARRLCRSSASLPREDEASPVEADRCDRLLQRATALADAVCAVQPDEAERVGLAPPRAADPAAALAPSTDDEELPQSWESWLAGALEASEQGGAAGQTREQAATEDAAWLRAASERHKLLDKRPAGASAAAAVAAMEGLTSELLGSAVGLGGAIRSGTVRAEALNEAVRSNVRMAEARVGALKREAAASGWAFLEHIGAVLLAAVVFVVTYLVIRIMPRGSW